MNYECPAEFNIPTSLLDCRGYKKRMQESTDPFKYQMAVRPGPVCMSSNQTFQGLMMAQRRPPPGLLGVENYLKSAPILDSQRDYVIDDIHHAKPPRMPKPLSNKLLIPECNELPGYQRTKIQSKSESPEWSMRIERNGKKYADYARPGRDTRAEVREAWKKKEQKEVSNSDIFGVSKYDKRALRPAANQDCMGDISCMVITGPDNRQTFAAPSVIPETGTEGMSVSTAANWNAAGIATTTSRPTFTSVPGAPVISSASGSAAQDPTARVAATINGNVPYTVNLTDQWRRAACNVRFENYTPTGC